MKLQPYAKTHCWIAEVVGQITDECILWPFARDSNGYGTITVAKFSHRATHVALFLDGRPRPNGDDGRPLIALHSCDNPPCINPRHLEWGTYQENLDQAVERRRVHRFVYLSEPTPEGHTFDPTHEKHGTPSGYTHHKCRCSACRSAWADYIRQLRNSDPARVAKHAERERERRRRAAAPERRSA